MYFEKNISKIIVNFQWFLNLFIHIMFIKVVYFKVYKFIKGIDDSSKSQASWLANMTKSIWHPTSIVTSRISSMVKHRNESSFLDAISKFCDEPFNISMVGKIIFISCNEINWNIFRNSINIDHWRNLGTVLGDVIFRVAVVELFKITCDDVLTVMKQLLYRACAMYFRVINDISCRIIIRSISFEPLIEIQAHSWESIAEPRPLDHSNINLMNIK